MHPTPGRRIFPQFPQQQVAALPSSDSGDLASLLEDLENGEQLDPSPQQQRPLRNPPGAQAYVNRLLTSVTKLPITSIGGLTSGLSSHSFRRGGAMRANADNRLSSLWVVDRCGWSTSSVNKAFGYMLNTTQEDQQAARQLSGWNPKAGATFPDLSCLDGVVRVRATRLQQTLFGAAAGFSNSTWNVDEQVLEVLTATLIMHYACMRRHRGQSPFVIRVRETIAALSMPESELLAMAVTIRGALDAPAKDTTKGTTSTPTDQLEELIVLVKAQTLQLNEILARQAKLEKRLDRLEAKTPSSITVVAQDDTIASRAAKRVRKQPPKSLSDSWYEWFADQPRPYESAAISKSKRYEYRYAVAYMMLFLPDGIKLDTTSLAYKSEVRSLGIKAERNTLAFTASRESNAAATGPVVKLLRDLEKAGELKKLIADLRRRRNQGEIVEQTPASALPEFARP